MSREHLITKAMYLDKEVTVYGLPWSGEEGKKVSLTNLTAKVLCTAHNSKLSDVDQEAVRFARAMRESFRLLEARVRANDGRRWRMKRFHLDGHLLERWFLKTLINVTCDRGWPIGTDSNDIGLPSKSLVEIAFGRKTFEPKAGLYGVDDTAESKPSEDGIGIHTFNTRMDQVLGAVFSFLGFRVLLFLDSEGPTMPVMEIATTAGAVAERVKPIYHADGVTYNTGKGISHAIGFKW